MGINAGLGITNFSFDDAKGFWRWVDLCDEGGVDSIWQSDRIIESSPNLETMSVMAALMTNIKNQVRHERRKFRAAEPNFNGQNMCNS